MASDKIRPERAIISPGLEIPRMLHGLWQLAGGHDKHVDLASASAAVESLVEMGLDGFDMADHYGDAELVVGYHNSHSQTAITTAFTKWCPPENGVKTYENAEAAVDLALQRMGQQQIALLQCEPNAPFSVPHSQADSTRTGREEKDHVWDYTNDTYIHNLCHLQSLQDKHKIVHIGLTNTDTAHLEMLLDTGLRINTNQVSCSVIDRRVVRGRMEAVCVARNVGLLCYGTLLGGFLSEKWLDQPEPSDDQDDDDDEKKAKLNWSLRKYLRFIHAAGGWAPFQVVLKALHIVAQKHRVPISAVATRWVLDIPSVKAVIVGTRLNSDSAGYAAKNLLAFSFGLDDQDMAMISKAQEGLKDIPGDCGDEYRRPPYLTATGDLSHHLVEADHSRQVREAIAKGQRVEYLTGSKWEPICGYSRAVRIGSQIHVSGTTANTPPGISHMDCMGGKSAASQATRILDIIEGALKALGSSMKDVARTRIILRDAEDAEAVSEVHGWRMRCVGILPANTLIIAKMYEEQMRVEIETWAEVGLAEQGVLRILMS